MCNIHNISPAEFTWNLLIFVVHEDEKLYIEIVIDFKQGELDDNVSSKVFQQHSSTVGAVCILLANSTFLLMYFVSIPDVVANTAYLKEL